MQKQKFKLNVLDVVIVVAIICSIAVIGFHDYISEIFSKPEIAPVTAVVVINNDVQNQDEKFKIGESVSLDLGNNIKIQAVIVSFEKRESGNQVGLSFNGYERMGRYYSELGVQIKWGEFYTLDINGEIVSVKVDDLRFSSEND